MWHRQFTGGIGWSRRFAPTKEGRVVMSLVIRTKVLAIVLYAAVGWCVAEAAPTIKVDAEGGFIGTLISGSGWVPGEGVKVQLSDSPESNRGDLPQRQSD
jgi:hypothetical protein